MANKKFWLVILSTVLVFGFSVVELNAQTTSGGTFTLTSIPSRYNGKYVVLEGEDDRGNIELYGAARINDYDEDMYTGVRISNGEVIIPMWIVRDDEDISRYTGNHNIELYIYIFDKATIELWEDDEIAEVYFERIRFTNGNARRSWDDADDIDY